MSLRTKLIGLLSGLLLVVVVSSTLAGRYLLQRLVHDHLTLEAEATARDLASNLEDYLKRERSDEELKSRLEDLRSRHRIFQLSLRLDNEVGEPLRIVLPESGSAEILRPTHSKLGRGRTERAVQYDLRRALLDNDDAYRPPSLRGGEPLWRLPWRSTSTRWAQVASPQSPQGHQVRSIQASQQIATCQQCVSSAVELVLAGLQRGELSVTIPADRFDPVLRDQIRVSAIIAVAAVIALLLASAWTVHRIVGGPVSELSSAMRAVEAGNLTRRVRVARRDELGQLGAGFNAMLGRLAQADNAVRRLNSRLVEDVQLATTDLQAKNEALHKLNQLLLTVQRELSNKERLAALGQLAAQLAHEIGTPLAAVSAHLQLASLSRELSGQVGERLQVAVKELDRVSKIIRDYLDQTRSAKPNLVLCDLQQVAEEAVYVTTTAGPLDAPGIAIECGEPLPPVVTDPGLLRQILINLLKNAMDATQAGTAPTDAGTAICIRLTTGPSSRSVEIAVSDTGVGIAPEDLGRIFEPFYTTKGRGRGSGLGLSICRELTRSLGGTLRAESAPGRGSTFVVSLPNAATSLGDKPRSEDGEASRI